MSTNDESGDPRQVALTEGLGLVPVAYLYHDAQTTADACPWLHSTMLVLAADRRPGLRGETALVTLAQAEAMVAAGRERCADVRAAAQYVLDRFRESQERGSSTRDRVFAIDVLAKALVA